MKNPMTRRVATLMVSLLTFSIHTVGGATETTVNFLTPPVLVKPNGYYGHQAATEFGLAPCPFSYKDQNCRIEAALYYIDTLLCTDEDLAAASQIIIQANTSPLQPPFWLMVNRGGCLFVTKVRNAQSILAANNVLAEIAGLVIATDADSECQSVDSNSGPCEVEMMTDDDSSSTGIIYLPSVVLEKQDADAVKEQIMLSSTTGTNTNESPVRMELAWEVAPVQSDTLELDFWHLPSPYRTTTTATTSQQQDIPHLLGQALEQLSDQVRFTPKFHIVSGLELGCNPDELGTASDDLCLDRCTNNGRYCAEDPEGANLIEESLRRMCLWDQYGSNETDPIGLLWWQYLEGFYETCTTEDYRTTEEATSYNNLLADDSCSRAVMEAMGINYVYITVSRCVVSSGGTTENKENDLLEASLREREASPLASSIVPPTLAINNVPFRGKTLSETFGATCASFTTNAVPDICWDCANCSDEYNCLMNRGVCSEQDNSLVAPTVAPTTATDQTSSQPNAATPAPIRQNPNDTALSPSSSGNELNIPSPSPVNPSEGHKDDSDSDGLSDTTKMVIVVAVVGGAILVIFAFVMVFVWRLFKRIRHLEGEEKGKETPTTTSPAGSGVWNLPHYVTTKEDPFNSDFEPVPDARVEPIQRTGNDDKRKEEIQIIPPAVGVATATDVVPGEEMHADVAVEAPTEPRSMIPLPEKNNTVEHSLLIDLAAAPFVGTGGSVSDDQSSAASKTRGEEKVQARGDATPETPKSRRSKQGNSMLDIMGRAAPEAKIPRSFSYEDEEKEEIEEVVDEVFLRV